MSLLPFFGRKQAKRQKARRVTNRRRRILMESLENRRVLANLNLLASGNLIYGGGAEVNTLEVSFAAGDYTFNDTSGTAVTPIGVAGFAALDTNPAANIVTFNAAAADALLGGGTLTQIVLNGNGGNDIYTISGLRGGGGEGIDIRDDAGEGSDTINITGSLGTAGSRLGNTVTLRSETINLGGDIFTTSSTITVGEQSSLPAATINVIGASEIDAGTGTAAINALAAAVTGTGDLTVDGDSVQLRGDVMLSGASAISLNATDSLQVGTTANNTELSSGTGAISLTGGTSSTLTDSISTGGPVSITSPSTGMGDAAGVISGTSVTVSGTLSNTSGNLTDIDATSGTISIGGQLSSTSGVDIDAPGNIDLDGTVSATDIDITSTGGSITVPSLQASAGDVNVGGPVTFDGGGPALVSSTGDVTFDNTVTGDGNNLTLQAPDLVDVDGAIMTVDTLRVEASGGAPVTQVDLDAVTATSIIVTGTTINLGGNLDATGGTGGSVNLTGSVIVTGAAPMVTSGGDAGESIVVTGTINGDVADTNALTLDAGNAGDVTITDAAGLVIRLLSLSVRGDTVNTEEINVATDLTVRAGDIRLNDAVTGGGTGTATFAPAVPGNTLDIFNNPAATRQAPNTRIASDTLSNIADGAFANFQFGDAATGIITVNPDADNSLTTGTLELSTPTEFEAGAIIMSEDIDSDDNAVTFETDNLAIFRGVIDTGDVTINKKTPGGTLELRGRVGSPAARWGNLDITINAVGATVNAPAAGAALPVLGLGTNQPQVDLGGTDVTLTVNADTLNALATSAIQSSGDLALNVDTLNLVGGVQTAGVGTVTIGNGGAAINNIGGGILSVLLPPASDVSLANFDGNTGDLSIRGVGGELGTVTLDGITDTGAVTVGTGTSNDAVTLNITDDISAESVVLRGNVINLDGDITATAGNVHLIGPVTLTGNSALNNTTGPSGQVIVNGTIDGAFSLGINAGTGTISLTGTVGGTTDLDSMTLVSGGVSFLTVAIEVTNGFSWIVGVAGNGINDRIIRAGAGSITSTNGPITLEADVLQGITSGVNVIGPGQTLTQRGAGD